MNYPGQICLSIGKYFNRGVWKTYLGEAPWHYKYCVIFLGWYSTREGFIPDTSINHTRSGFSSISRFKKQFRLATNKERTEIELAHY